MALRTVIYARKSSKDTDEKQVNSIPRQKDDLASYLKKSEVLVDDPAHKLVFDLDKDLFFEDASAKIVGRPIFNTMIQAIKKKKYDVLLCTDLTRLSRNAVDNGTLVQLLEDCDVKEIRSLDHRFTNSPTEKFTLGLLLSISKYENDQRAVNTASGMRHQRKKGVTTYKAPLGYINCGNKKNEKWVEADPESFDKCIELWNLFLTDSYSLRDLKAHANSIGVTLSRKGQRVSPSLMTIRGMLSNPYYKGLLKDHDENGQETWIEGNQQAMISESQFEKAQMLLQKRGYKYAKMDKAPSLAEILKAIMVSGIYTVKRKEGKEVRAPILYSEKTRYTCSNCKKRYYSALPSSCKDCSTMVNEDTKIEHHYRLEHLLQDGSKKNSMKFEVVEEWLKKGLDKLYITEGFFNVIKKRLFTLWLKREKQITKSRQSINAKIESLQTEKTKVYRKSFEDNADPASVDMVVKKIEDDLEVEEDRLEELKEKFEEEFEVTWLKVQVLRAAKDIMIPNSDFEPKKRLLLSLISNLVLFEDRLEIEWKTPFDKAVKLNLKESKGGAGPTECLGESLNGSPGWIRTNDQAINSRLLYH